MAFVVGFGSGAVPMVGGVSAAESVLVVGAAVLPALWQQKAGGIGRGKVFALLLTVIFWFEYKT